MVRLCPLCLFDRLCRFGLCGRLFLCRLLRRLDPTFQLSRLFLLGPVSLYYPYYL